MLIGPIIKYRNLLIMEPIQQNSLMSGTRAVVITQWTVDGF